MRKARPAELVLGSVQLGLAYGAANRTGKPSRGQACRLVSRAVDAGITKFDTARAYGDAEERLGEALAHAPGRSHHHQAQPFGGARARCVAARGEGRGRCQHRRFALCPQKAAYRLSIAASRRTYDGVRRRRLGAADRTAGRRNGADARRFGAEREGSHRRARLSGRPSHAAPVQSSRLALGRGGRDRAHPPAFARHHPCAQRLPARRSRRRRSATSGRRSKASMPMR